ncbi:hypothetical protein BJ165DRAFT_1613093 [Panaeolus papilionaceus]|nr:hypothetical protein BJ165DRAFT_1613093 [Panaeolus papilionaceus]
MAISFFHPRVKRQLIWFSFAFSWIVFGISYSLLFLGGQQYVDIPDKGLCSAQTGFIYAAPYLVASTSLALVLHILLSTIVAISRRSFIAKNLSYFSAVLVAFPWGIWAAVLTCGLIVAFSHPDQVVMSPNQTYCIIIGTPLPKITAMSVVALASFILLTEVTIGILLNRNGTIPSILKCDMQLFIRILVFTLLAVGSIAVILVCSITPSQGVTFDIMIAIVPLASAIHCGTQSDILRALLCKYSVPCPDADSTSIASVTTTHSAHHEQRTLPTGIFNESTKKQHALRSNSSRESISSREPDIDRDFKSGTIDSVFSLPYPASLDPDRCPVLQGLARASSRPIELSVVVNSRADHPHQYH